MTDTPSASPPKFRRRRRWWLRLPLIGVGLVVTIVVLAQIFLWTDYPRRIAEAQVTQILGVRTSIGAIRIGWLGHTQIDDLALTLPMEHEPFLRVAHVRAAHTSLPLIAFDQTVSEAEVDGVRLDARQDVNGRWNLEALIPPAASGTTQPASGSKRNLLADLPNLRARDVRVTLARSDGKRLELEPVAANLRKLDPLLASLDANVGQTITVSGQIGLTAAMQHTLRVRLASIPAAVADFVGMANLPALAADLGWQGRRTGDGVAGTLTIDGVTLDAVRATGRVDVEQGSAGVILRPISLAVTVADGAAADVKLNAGRIVVAGNTVDVEQLRGTINGGRFAAQGQGDLASLASNLILEWEQVRRADLSSTGSLTLTTTRTLAGRLGATATVRGDATVPAGHGSGSIVVRGEGDAVDAFTADVGIQPLTWTPANGGTAITVPELRGQIVGTGKTLTLAAFGLADVTHGTLAAFGAFDLARQAWWATVDAGQLTSPLLASNGVKGPLDVHFAADGTLTRIDAREVYAKLDRGTVWAQGAYDFATPRPLRLQTWAWYDKPVTEDEAAQLNSARAVGTIEGVLAPRDLSADMDVNGSELVFAGRPFGDVAIHVMALIGEDVATIRSRDMQVLGGTWTLQGDWSRASGKPPTLVASVVDLPMSALGEVLDRSDLKGTIARGSATFTLRSTRLDQIEGVAAARGSDLSAGPLHADALELTATLKDGHFDARPTLREKDGTIAVQATGDVRLAAPINVNVTLADWPAPPLTRAAQDGETERFSPIVSGTVKADVALASGDVNADVALNGKLNRDDESLAGFTVEAALRRTLFTLTHASIDTLDGTIAATGGTDLRNPNGATLDVELKHLVPSRLAWLNPVVQELNGEIDGTVSLHPSRVERPLGPAQIEMSIRPSADANYHGVMFGAIDVSAFLDIGSLRTLRLVSDHVSLNVADGTVEPFARVSREANGAWSQLVTADFTRLDLSQLAKVADERGTGMDVVGRVGGRVQLFGNALALDRLSGNATINITESDLANFPPISALYDALSVGLAGKEPNGSGSVSLRVGEGVLTIDDASYFNRGVYASAFGPLRGIDRLPNDATIDHVVVLGSLQPLRAVKLPFFGDVNDTLAALQSSVTAIDVTGTTRAPKMQQVALGGLGDTARKILLGKAKGQ